MPKKNKRKEDDGSGDPAKSPFADGKFPYDDDMDGDEYRKTLGRLQMELLKAQRWVKDAGERVLVIFEGRDAAGKGGAIKRFTANMNPRGARVVALAKPNETERGQWYFQRYIVHLPTAGEFVFFDRSWYNRAGVEPVMGFCTPAEYRDFLRQVSGLERGIVDAGLRLFKLWFQIGRNEQIRRFDARKNDPLRHWKLSPVDLASLDKWDEYTTARDRMFFNTHTRDAPWTVILAHDKKRARINSIRHVLHALPYPEKDLEVVTAPDPNIVGPPPAAEPDHAQFREIARGI